MIILKVRDVLLTYGRVCARLDVHMHAVARRLLHTQPRSAIVYLVVSVGEPIAQRAAVKPTGRMYAEGRTLPGAVDYEVRSAA
jgi:hypothetical protein